MDKTARIFVAGHRGLVGSAIVRRLSQMGYPNLILRSHKALDLTDQQAVAAFFAKEQPEYVFLSAAKVGGIYANNTYPADFIRENINIQQNIIHQAYLNNVKRLLFLGSSCIYPKLCPQPMKETHLLTGPLEPTNRPYAVAKIAGIEMCSAYNRQYGTQYLAAMPTNLYGPNDNYDLQNSHVLPALIRKFHEAKVTGKSFVEAWGSGQPRREFLYVDDMADACVYLMNLPEADFLGLLTNDSRLPLVNVGCGQDVTIAELVALVKSIVGFEGEVRWDHTKPDGTPRKLLDVTRLTQFGWSASVALADGIRQAYHAYKENLELV